MDTILTFLTAALNPLQAVTMKIWSMVPSIVAALLLLLIGSFVGRWVRYVAEHVLQMTNIDDYSKKIGVSKVLTRLGFGPSPTKTVGFLVYALIFLSFLLSAADAVGLVIVSEFLHRVLLFMPKLIAAVLVLGGGLFLGTFAGHIVYRAAEANHVKGADALSKVTYGLLVIFSSLMALQSLGIDTAVISNSIQIIIASIGLGFAIAFGVAFGMAGRDTAERWIKDLVPKSVRSILANGHGHHVKEHVGK